MPATPGPRSPAWSTGRGTPGARPSRPAAGPGRAPAAKDREARIKREILRLAAQAAQQNDAPTYNGTTDGLLQMPVSGPVTSPFGWRTHPIYGYWGLHDGTDFGAGCGASL